MSVQGVLSHVLCGRTAARTSGRTVRRAVPYCTALFIAFSHDVAGQVVRGTVRDEATRAIVADARVTLRRAAGDSVATVIAAQGVFELRAPGPGSYRLSAERLGYATTRTEPLALDLGAAVTVTLFLGVNAIPLAALRVESRTAQLPHLEDIQERMKQGNGRFLTRADIVKLPGREIPDLLATVPGLRISATEYGDRVVNIRARPTQTTPTNTLSDPELEAFRQTIQCPTKLYVDGVPWLRDHMVYNGSREMVEEARALNAEFMKLHAEDIEVIEIYNGAASIPGVYGGSDAACG